MPAECRTRNAASRGALLHRSERIDLVGDARADVVVGLYMDIRGYGPVKEQAVDDVRTRVANKINTLATMEQRAA